MARGDKDEFRVKPATSQTYADGTVVPHLAIEIWRNGVYRGYVECHTHKVTDDSISVGATVRLATKAKPV